MLQVVRGREADKEIRKTVDRVLRPVADGLGRLLLPSKRGRIFWVLVKAGLGFGLPYPLARFVFTSSDSRCKAITSFVTRSDVAVPLATAYILVLVMLVLREIGYWKTSGVLGRVETDRDTLRAQAMTLDKNLAAELARAERAEASCARAVSECDSLRATLETRTTELDESRKGRAIDLDGWQEETRYLLEQLGGLASWFRQPWWYDKLHLIYWLDSDPTKGRFERVMDLGFPGQQSMILTTLEEIHIGAHGLGVPSASLAALDLRVRCIPDHIMACVLPKVLGAKEPGGIVRHYAHVLLFSREPNVQEARVELAGDWPNLWQPLWESGEDYGVMHLKAACKELVIDLYAPTGAKTGDFQVLLDEPALQAEPKTDPAGRIYYRLTVKDAKPAVYTWHVSKWKPTPARGTKAPNNPKKKTRRKEKRN